MSHNPARYRPYGHNRDMIVPRSTRKHREFSERYAQWIVHPEVAVPPPYDIDTKDDFGDLAADIHPPTNAFYRRLDRLSPEGVRSLHNRLSGRTPSRIAPVLDASDRWIVPKGDNEGTDWRYHVGPPGPWRGDDSGFSVVYLQPTACVFHGSKTTLGAGEILSRGNFFGTREYARTYTRRPDGSFGRLHRFRLRTQFGAMPLVPVDECDTWRTVVRLLRNLGPDAAPWRLYQRMGRTEGMSEITRWIVDGFGCNIDERRRPRMGPEVLVRRRGLPPPGNRRTGTRMMLSEEDAVLFPMLCCLLPEGVAGFVQRQKIDDGAEIYVCDPAKWLVSDGDEPKE